jgi:hypothetical protein
MKLSEEELAGVRRKLADREIVVRWHHLKAFGRSNAQGYAALMGEAPERHSAAIESGEAVDSELLDGIDGNVIAVPDVTDKKGNTAPLRRDERSIAWLEFQAANPGKIILTQSEHGKVMSMVASLREHKLAMSLLAGERKSPIQWPREEGIWCQGTPDSRSRDYLTDLKRTSPANLPTRFNRHAFNMGWTGQLAFYQEAMGALDMDPDVYFVVVEAEPSLRQRRHEVAIFHVTPQVLEEGRKQVDAYWARLLEFLETGDVSGYGGGNVIEMSPMWQEAA